MKLNSVFGDRIIKCSSIISPKFQSKVLIRLKFNRKLQLKNPVLFNDKIQWLKLYGNLPFMERCADKFLVREHIKEKGYENILTKVYQVVDKPEEIDYEKLPNKCVIKCNHGCGCNIIVEDLKTLDKKKTNKLLKKYLRKDYSRYFGEIQYKHIPRKIIIEEYIESDLGHTPDDYKFFAFDGRVECVMVCVGRRNGVGRAKYYFFDNEWKLMRINGYGKSAPKGFTIPKPEKMDEMWKIAEDLSKGIPFVRVDLYCEKNRIYFGELTFTPGAGADENLKEVEQSWGDKIKLPKKGEKYEDNRLSDK